MTRYATVQDGDGKAGPLPDTFRPWLNCRDASDQAARDEFALMVAGKFIRENGIKANRQPRTFTVFHYDQATPMHANGRPQIVCTVTMTAWPEDKA